MSEKTFNQSVKEVREEGSQSTCSCAKSCRVVNKIVRLAKTELALSNVTGTWIQYVKGESEPKRDSIRPFLGLLKGNGKATILTFVNCRFERLNGIPVDPPSHFMELDSLGKREGE